jgi:S-formylglutathione hydrolase FrmB
MWLMHLSLLGGWLPAVVAALAWSALVFGVAWWRRPAWQWIVVSAGALLTTLVLEGFVDPRASVGTYPRSFVVWVALPVFAAGAAAWQWPRVRWWRRAVALAAVPTLAAFAGLQINAHYAYLPTLGDLLGAPLAGQVDARQIVGPSTPARQRPQWATSISRKLVSGGIVTQLDIPAPVSHFRHRPGWVWLPPEYFSEPRSQLPVLMLMSGAPGLTDDWLRGGGALNVANAWAVSHKGDAPIMVFPDGNGSVTGDTECVDGPRGNAETYLTVDVPAFMHARFGASTDRRRWAIAGLSEGGTCALELASRHPDRFATFGDFSGDIAPTLWHDTVRNLYGSSWAEVRPHDPATWFAIDAAAGVEGFVAVGTRDYGYVPREQRIVEEARRDGMHMVLDLIPGGGHQFGIFRRALRDAFPWIVARVETEHTFTVATAP